MTASRLLLAFTTLAGAPNIIPEGYREIDFGVRVELGPLADTTCVQHAVAKGETLRSIALDHLGDAARWQEILAVNPDPMLAPVAERTLAAGALWLPPKSPRAAVEQLTFAFAGRFSWSHAQPLVGNSLLRARGSEMSSLLLCTVPAADLPKVAELARLRDQQVDLAQRARLMSELEDLLAAPRFTKLSALLDRGLAHRSDPSVRRVDTYRVEPMPGRGAEPGSGGSLPGLVRVRIECWDRLGNKGQPRQPLASPVPTVWPLVWPPVPAGTSDAGNGDETTLLLLLLAGVGAGALWCTRTWRSPPTRPLP